MVRGKRPDHSASLSFQGESSLFSRVTVAIDYYTQTLRSRVKQSLLLSEVEGAHSLRRNTCAFGSLPSLSGFGHRLAPSLRR
jgi:hypothetical protein